MKIKGRTGRMKGGVFEPVLLFGIIVFVGFMGILGASFFTESQKIGGFTNQSNVNLTIISTGESIVNPNLCDYTGEIPIIGGLIWGADCIADYVGFIFGFIALQSDSPWLQAIFVGAIAVVIYLAIRILRGN